MSFARTTSVASKAFCLTLIIAFGTLLATFRLNWQPYWLDEYTTLLFTRLDWSVLMIDMWGVDTHRPIYYGLQKAWNSVVGTGLIGTRLLSVLLLLLSVPIIFRIAQELKLGPWAYAAALLYVSNPMFIQHARQIRMYALVDLILVAALYFAVMLVKSNNSSNTNEQRTPGFYLSCFTGFLALAFYVQSLAVFVAILFLLWGLIAVASKDLPARFLILMGVAAAVYCLLLVPALAPFFKHMNQTVGGKSWFPETSLGQLYRTLTGAYPFPKWFKPIMALLLLWGFWTTWRNYAATGKLLVVLVAGLPILVFCISFFEPLLLTRVIAWSSLISAFVFAIGLRHLPGQWPWVGLGLALTASLSATWMQYPQSPIRPSIAGLETLIDSYDPEQDLVVIGLAKMEPELEFYAPRLFEGPVISFLSDSNSPPFLAPVFQAQPLVLREISERLEGKDNVFLISPADDPLGLSPVRAELRGQFDQITVRENHNFTFDLYSRKP